jgi:hypothetical protein
VIDVKTNIHLWSYLAQLFLESEIFQTKVVEKIETHSVCSTFFSEKGDVNEISKKCGNTRQSTDGNVTRCMHICTLDN